MAEREAAFVVGGGVQWIRMGEVKEGSASLSQVVVLISSSLERDSPQHRALR